MACIHAEFAAAVVLKNSTLSRFGFFAVHDGRQKIPVVFTPAKKIPSKEESFSNNARYIISSVNIMQRM
jgi:hypothetical protein